MNTSISKILVSLCCFISLMAQAADESCECPKLACDSCSIERGVSFYTSKCGPQNMRLKSCARPTCVPIPVATKECPNPPAASKEPRQPVVVNADAKLDPSADLSFVGKVKVLKGSVAIVRADGKRSVIEGEGRVQESDTLESGSDGTALVNFDGGNKLHVHPGTSVQVKQFSDSSDATSRKAVLHLIKGKIRNQVEQKYNGSTSYYRVQTTAAVAGVRGTDFLMEHQEDKKLETKVEAFDGKVTLASLDEKEARQILRGEGAKFTVDLPDASFKGSDYTDFIRRGTLSPVYKIPPQQLAEMDWESRVDVAKKGGYRKKVPLKETEICEKPKGLFNQCAWRCVGNPVGQKTCRTDKPGVTCVRTRCNANGIWADETPLPGPSAEGRCPATGFTVKACDY